MDEVHAKLPREIRDMIWNYLLVSLPGSVELIDQILTDTALNAKTCKEPSDGPWPVQACFVGPWARAEILEIRYRKIFRTPVFKYRGILLLEGLATADAYNTGLKPIQFLRHLELHWDMGGQEWQNHRDPEYWPQSTEQPSWKACFEALRCVKHKSHFTFDLRIRETGSNRSGKHLRHLLETFRPVYEELRAAGAKINISRECWRMNCDKFWLDLAEYYTMDADEWYAQFLERCIESDLIARKRLQAARLIEGPDEITTNDVQDWHVEDDQEVDEMFERRRTTEMQSGPGRCQ